MGRGQLTFKGEDKSNNKKKKKKVKHINIITHNSQFIYSQLTENMSS